LKGASDALARAALATTIVAIAALAGCADLPRKSESVVADAAAIAAPFDAEGRLSARRGGDGVSGQFVWTHDGARDRIVLSTPLGQTIARLSGDAAGVRVEASDGRVETASAWDALTARTLGFPLPVAGLAAWLRGLPRPDSPNTMERDGAGRPLLLVQDGWQIAYAYADDAAARAARLTLRFPGSEPVELRIVVDRWQ
jgi:outer membrane lipoprotein LolB